MGEPGIVGTHERDHRGPRNSECIGEAPRRGHMRWAAEMSQEFQQRGERKDVWGTEESLGEAGVASRRKFIFLHRFSLACLLNSSFLFKRKSYN